MIKSIKILIKKIFLPVLFWLGFFDFIFNFINKKYVILMFHGVHDYKNIKSFNPRHIPLRTFKRQICFLKKHFDFISLHTLLDLIKEEKLNQVKKNKLAVTFDDGYKNNQLILPFIEKHSVPVTIFVTTEFLDRKQGSLSDIIDYLLSKSKVNYIKFYNDNYNLRNKKDRNRLKSKINELAAEGTKESKLIKDFYQICRTSFGELNNLQNFFEYLTKGELKRISNNNFITIGSHSKTHLNLNLISKGRLEIELSDSKELLESLTNKNVEYFSYPYGEYNELVMNTIVKYYSCACTIHPRTKKPNIYELPRVSISADDNFYLHILYILRYLIKSTFDVEEYLSPKNFLRKLSKKLYFIKRKLFKPFVKINKTPIFVFGNQKSGTTVIAALLAIHSDSSCTLDVGRDIAKVIYNIKQNVGSFEIIPKKYKYEFSKKIIKDLWLTFIFENLYDTFHNGKFIQIIRDPRDNIRSICNRLNIPGNLDNLEKHFFPSRDSGWYYVLKNDWLGITEGNYIEILAKRWNYCIESYLTNKEQINLVRYEDFVENKEKYIIELTDNLGLPHKTDISEKVDYQFQPAGNKDISWINFFGENNLRKINKICKNNMNKVGYKT